MCVWKWHNVLHRNKLRLIVLEFNFEYDNTYNIA